MLNGAARTQTGFGIAGRKRRIQFPAAKYLNHEMSFAAGAGDKEIEVATQRLYLPEMWLFLLEFRTGSQYQDIHSRKRAARKPDSSSG